MPPLIKKTNRKLGLELTRFINNLAKHSEKSSAKDEKEKEKKLQGGQGSKSGEAESKKVGEW